MPVKGIRVRAKQRTNANKANKRADRPRRAMARINQRILKPTAHSTVCSDLNLPCSASVWPSYGLPGKLLAPTIRPLAWLMAMLALTSNS